MSGLRARLVSWEGTLHSPLSLVQTPGLSPEIRRAAPSWSPQGGPHLLCSVSWVDMTSRCCHWARTTVLVFLLIP